MSELVRIKNLKTGEHMMVKPEYAARTKMLNNSGWVVEDLKESKLLESKPILQPVIEVGVEEVDENLPLAYQEANKEVEPRRRGRQPGTKVK